MLKSYRLLHVMDVRPGAVVLGMHSLLLLLAYVGLSGCSAHATASFSEREALLAKEKNASAQMKQGTLKPVPHIAIAKKVQSKTQTEELESQAGPASEKPVSSEEFATAQNPQKKSLKAALTCGRMVLKKGGRASCFAPVRMWREDIEITCNFAVAIFSSNGSLKRLNCEGDVHIVTSDRLGVAQRAIYDEQNQKITLEEDAKLKQRGMQLQGQKVVMDLISEEVSVEGGVQGIYTPQTKQKKKK
jgi:hypothetical protein